VEAASPPAEVKRQKRCSSDDTRINENDHRSAITGHRQPAATAIGEFVRDRDTRGEIVYEQQFGERFIPTTAAAGLPANADTLFRIASVSKMVTRLA
jgi:CubicO group peptidase (beta-lactamase class C family)